MSSASTSPSELSFFATLASCGSLTAAARDLGLSKPAVSKRLAQMEARLGLTLVNRTTRRMSLTPEGELYLQHARRILTDIDGMYQTLAGARGQPAGLLRVNATLGFGRSFVAPVISQFAKAHPAIEVQLQLTVRPPPLDEDAFDVCVRFGQPPDARVIARKIAPNRRILCASPAYIARHGTPQTPSDLARHLCITIRQGDDGYGVWRLAHGQGEEREMETVRVHGALSTNDGEIAVNWALDGHGVLMRAEWDVERYLRSGRLVQVLQAYQTPDADIYAVFPRRHQLSPRVRAFVDLLGDALPALRGG